MNHRLSLPLLGMLLSLVVTPAYAAQSQHHAPPRTCGDRHVVKRGDTLSRIARRCGVTMAELVAANHLANPNLIRIGQVLIIPTGSGVMPPPGTARIIAFQVTPTAFRPGDRLTFTWEAVGGEYVLICPAANGQIFRYKCFSAPLIGAQVVATDSDAISYTEFTLRVQAGGGPNAFTLASATVGVQVDCRGYRDWFFENAPATCPALPLHSSAAAQRFERGRMIWVAATGEYFAFFYPPGGAQGEYRRVFDPLSLKPGASVDNRIGLTPPPGLHEPVSGFGLIWRGEVWGAEDIRPSLGWAVETEFGFQTVRQCEMALSAPLRCYLRTPEGTVISYYHYGSPRWEYWPRQ